MSHYKEFPEILAMLIFLPVGIFMGHMLNYVQTTTLASFAFYDVKYWPFIVGGIVAIFTAIAHLGIKHKFQQYKYEHMYFQIVGLIILLITGVLLMCEELQAVAFVGFIAHGIIYVSALSYINIRMGKSKYRYLKLSIPHLMYLIGIAIGATLVWVANDFIFYQPSDSFWIQYTYNSISTGTTLLITSSFMLGGFLINEVLQHTMQSFNYKQSLDEDINRENTNKDILKNKYFHITPPNLNFPANVQFPAPAQLPLKTEWSVMKELGRILYALSSKVLTLSFFYYPFLALFTIASTISYDENIFLVKWFGAGGLVISLILIALINYKINYLLSISIKIVCMVALLIVFSHDFVYWDDIKILFWFLFIGLGFGLSHPDINILTYTNLKSNEIVLAIGYFIEHLIIGVLQYQTVFHALDIFNISSNFNVIFPHALTFLLIIGGIGMIGIFLIPNGKHSSLLEVKNILNNCANINQLVNTGNYDGQQNPQLYWQQQMYLLQHYPQIAQIPPQVPPIPYDPNNTVNQMPHSQNMLHYGRSDMQTNYPPQQYQQYPHPQYQQTPYINTTYPSQTGIVHAAYHNTNPLPISTPPKNDTTLSAVAMMPQRNLQNLPPNVAPLIASPSQYDQNISRPIISPTNIK